MIYAGVDAGSRAIKVVLYNGDQKKVVGRGICDQGVQQDRLTQSLLLQTLKNRGFTLDRLAGIVSTGYGRDRVLSADRKVTEITCHAEGVRFLVPEVRTLIEIGGQDSKVIRFNADGSVRDFSMNDRCAAGTGRFLEVVAQRLDLRLEELDFSESKEVKQAVISSMCVVFAETEIIGLLATGTPREEIVAGVRYSMATRVASLAGGHIDEPIVFAGGVPLVPGMKEALALALRKKVRIAPDPQYTGALGAALIAAGQKVKS
ncbi:MAG: 2-hydroxyglutaryl-CoA dehydratase [Planctomycetes bacterium]|nr:2-hydroxyglutaryl-CoA dehydratase [Planctomycetota bacterium]